MTCGMSQWITVFADVVATAYALALWWTYPLFASVLDGARPHGERQK